MGKDLYFPFYAQDFLIGTAHMSLDEVGAYIKLLCYQWEVGKIPMAKIGLYLGNSGFENWEGIKDKFIEKNGMVWNDKLMDLKEKKSAYIRSQSNNGRLGGRPKKEKPTVSTGKTETKPKEKPKERLRIEIELYTTIVDYYHSTCTILPKVITLDTSRKRAIANRVKEHKVEGVKKALDMASKSEFLNGSNDNEWKATFDWIFNPKNMVKILEGNYEGNKGSSKSSTQTDISGTDHSVSA